MGEEIRQYREQFSEADYAAFLALFDQAQKLTLVDGMRVTPQARRVLSQVIADCLAREVSTLPDGSLVELLNFQQIFVQQAPYVRLLAQDGMLVLPAYQFERTVCQR